MSIDKQDGWLLLVSTVLLGLSAGALALEWPVGVSWVLIAFANAYFLAVLVLSARRSDHCAKVRSDPASETQSSKIFPSRTAGLFVAFAGFGIITLGFANVYLKSAATSDPIFATPICNGWQAIYVSLMVLGFGGPDPKVHWPVILELLSALNTLICIIPMLVSRVSTFEDLGVEKPQTLSINTSTAPIKVTLTVPVVDGEGKAVDPVPKVEVELKPTFSIDANTVSVALSQHKAEQIALPKSPLKD